MNDSLEYLAESKSAFAMGQHGLGHIYAALFSRSHGHPRDALQSAVKAIEDTAASFVGREVPRGDPSANILSAAVQIIVETYDAMNGAGTILKPSGTEWNGVPDESRFAVQAHLFNAIMDHSNLSVWERSPQAGQAMRDILNYFLVSPEPIADQINCEILEIVSRVATKICSIPYPTSFTVSSRWRLISDYSVSLVSGLDNAYHVCLYGMYSAAFRGMMLITPHPDKLKGSVAENRNGIADYLSQFDDMNEMPYAFPGSVVEVDRHRYTDDFLCYANYCRTITENLRDDEEVKTILEIGAGYGGVARAFNIADPRRQYILVDLPESLIFSYTYLRLSFPEKRFLMLDEDSSVQDVLAEGYDFIFCPVQIFAEMSWPEVDLVINMWSFGEMNQGCVDYFFEVINEKLNARFLYSHNIIFSDKNLFNESSGENGEGNQVVLKIDHRWRARSFDIVSWVGERDAVTKQTVYRNHAPVFLERDQRDLRPRESAMELAEESKLFDFGSWDWVTRMYLAALWTDTPNVIESFFEGLKIYLDSTVCITCADYDFNKIGEVVFLSERKALLMESAT